MSGEAGELVRLLSGDAEAIRLYALVLGRIAPALAFGPWLSRLGVSPLVRVALAVSLGGVFLPLAGPSGRPALPFLAALVLELLRGSVFLLGVMLPWIALDTTFGLVDATRGRFQTTGDEGQGPLPAMAAVLFAAVFASAGGFDVMIDGFSASFEAVPLGTAPDGGRVMDIVLAALRAVGDALAFGVRLAVPTLLASVLVDLAVAAASRAASSLTLAAALLPAFPALAIAVTCVVLARSGPHLVGVVRDGLVLAARWLSVS